MAAAAETLEKPEVEPYPSAHDELLKPYEKDTAAFLATDHESESRSGEDALRLIRSAGNIALKETVQPPPLKNLMQAIHEAGNGNQEARQLVEANVRKDVIERTLKSGHVTTTKVRVDSDGKLIQNGQYIDDVQKIA